ncbi:MAG: (2Fe-2S)-binding protein [Rhodocyclaceae bacterium]|nr:(2Fe-2S)-binding protein [Rhodocyclaceae bacterium]MDP3032559.1 (2Fe-2S)-binding protein [Rhodocyclaceae bacterium]
MYVCVCHAVTDSDIECAVAGGCCSLRQLSEQLGVGRTCGRCTRCARETIQDSLQPRASQPSRAVRFVAA